MKAFVRIVILGLTAAVCIPALKRWVYTPWWCMREIAAIGGNTLRADDMTSHARAVVLARENLARARTLEQRCPTSVQVYMYTAVNEQILGLDEDAIRTYHRALTIARRPEIYFALGSALLQTGRLDEALDAFAVMGSFDHNMIGWIDDPQLRQQIRERVEARERASPHRDRRSAPRREQS